MARVASTHGTSFAGNSSGIRLPNGNSNAFFVLATKSLSTHRMMPPHHEGTLPTRKSADAVSKSSATLARRTSLSQSSFLHAADAIGSFSRAQTASKPASNASGAANANAATHPSAITCASKNASLGQFPKFNCDEHAFSTRLASRAPAHQSPRSASRASASNAAAAASPIGANSPTSRLISRARDDRTSSTTLANTLARISVTSSAPKPSSAARHIARALEK
mmetsp:Transcript_8015/g.26519  ORF Transcript_8015/g.26519 Transcript_8015/m.26519 type:complete len:223 (-) Transcript_8015:181-849(-)